MIENAGRDLDQAVNAEGDECDRTGGDTSADGDGELD